MCLFDPICSFCQCSSLTLQHLLLQSHAHTWRWRVSSESNRNCSYLRESPDHEGSCFPSHSLWHFGTQSPMQNWKCPASDDYFLGCSSTYAVSASEVNFPRHVHVWCPHPLWTQMLFGWSLAPSEVDERLLSSTEGIISAVLCFLWSRGNVWLFFSLPFPSCMCFVSGCVTNACPDESHWDVAALSSCHDAGRECLWRTSRVLDWSQGSQMWSWGCK